MNHTIFWRLVWKEYRQQRALAGAMLGFAAILMLLAALAAAWEEKPISFETNVVIAFVIPMIYLLGCTATMFAGEHDLETFSFLRALPQRASLPFAAKVSFALASALMLLGGLLLVSVGCNGFSLDINHQPEVSWSGFLLTLFEVLAWGTLCSLVLRHPLWAIVATAGGALLTNSMIAVVFSRLYDSLEGYSPAFDVARAVLIVVVALVALRQGRRWFLEIRPRGREAMREQASGSNRREILPAVMVAFGRLVWQEWRQSRGIIAGIFGVFGALILMAAGLSRMSNESAGYVWSLPMMLLAGVAAVLGSCVFFADKWKQRYGFFAERGIGARQVWLARQAVWMTAAAVWTLVATAIYMIFVEMDYSVIFARSNNRLVDTAGLHETVRIPLVQIGLAVLCYSAAQLCSLFCRSGVVGLLCGFLLAWLVGLWAYFMDYLGVSYWVSLVPLVVLFLWASWLRAPDWIQERTSWRAKLKATASIVLPVIGVLVAVACYRVFEIPAVTLPAYVTTPIQATAEEQQTAEMYQDCWRKLLELRTTDTPLAPSGGGAEAAVATTTYPDSPERQSARRAEISRLVEISRRPNCYFAETRGGLETNLNCSQLAIFSRWLIDDAHRLMDDNRDDEALERLFAALRCVRRYAYRSDTVRQANAVIEEGIVMEEMVTWAAQANRSAESIRALAVRLSEERFGESWILLDYDRKSAIAHDYQGIRAYLDLDPVLWNELYGPERTRYFKLLCYVMPWERMRNRRRLDSWADLNHRATEAFHSGTQQQFLDKRAERNRANTILEWFNWMPASEPGNLTDPNSFYLRCQTQRAALAVRLALLAWRAEHGELPQSLDELTGMEFLTFRLMGLSSGRFVYRRSGHSEPIQSIVKSPYALISRPIETVPAGTPFLWVPGPLLEEKPVDYRVKEALKSGELIYLTYQKRERQEPLRDAEDFWKHGRPFPIAPIVPKENRD